MSCEHKRIKSVNCRYFCIDCGDEIPEAFVFGNKQPEKDAEEPKTGKSTGRKRNAKNAEKQP